MLAALKLIEVNKMKQDSVELKQDMTVDSGSRAVIRFRTSGRPLL